MSDIYEILTRIGYTLIDSGREYRANPIYRTSDNNSVLSINKNTGLWYDYAENIGGNLESLVKKTVGNNIDKDTFEFLSSYKYELNQESQIELETQQTFDKSLLSKLKKDNSYWNKRGISDETLAPFQGGVAISGKLMNRYVFPIWGERETLVGFAARYIYGDHPIKWKILGAKKTFLYPFHINKDDILNKGEIIIVESCGNALNLYQNGIKNILVSFGITISAEIIGLLLKLDIKKIYIAFDNDTKNNFVGNRAATKEKEKLLKYFDPEQVVIALPEGVNDFSEMSEDLVKKWKQTYQIN